MGSSYCFLADLIQILCPSQIVIGYGKRTDTLAGCCENRVAKCRRDPAEYLLADSGDRVVRRFYEMDGDLRHFLARQQWEIIEVALRNASLLDRYLLFHRGSKTHDHLHLDLPFRG